jgi:hypothetical protein
MDATNGSSRLFGMANTWAGAGVDNQVDVSFDLGILGGYSLFVLWSVVGGPIGTHEFLSRRR